MRKFCVKLGYFFNCRKPILEFLLTKIEAKVTGVQIFNTEKSW